MKRKNGQKRLFQLILCVMLMTLTVMACMVMASAADLEWNLLTDTEAGYRVVGNTPSRWASYTEQDGTSYMRNVDDKAVALYIYDDQNILGSYLTFSLEGDFYFESFPEGIRDGEYTPKDKPLSFLCWLYGDKETGAPTVFNALRLDNEGYIYTGLSGGAKTDVKLETGTWYNIRCVFTPKNGLSEMFINGEKALDFNIAAYDAERQISYAVRYFDGYYNWDAKMKNLKVKTDSDYTVETKRESSADYLGYQVTQSDGGAFSLRAVLGVNDTDFNRVGYEAFVLGYDTDGLLVCEPLSLNSKTIYRTLTDAAGNTYDIKELYGYNYAAALEIDELPLEPSGDFFELVIRPYTLGMDGIRRYGLAASLLYKCEADEDGYPVLVKQTGKRYLVKASADTYIYNGNSTQDVTNYGTLKQLVVRNPGNETTDQFRAAYFKFTLDERMVRSLATAISAKLRIYVLQHEVKMDRKQYDMILHGTGTDWTETDLTFANYQTLAPTYEEIGRGDYELGGYVTIDILPYLKEQIADNDSADGSLTVSFRLTNEGHEDTIGAIIGSRESNAPMIEIENSLYYPVLELPKSANVGYEPWGYAEHIVDEWFDEIVDKVYPRDKYGDLIYHEIDAFEPEGYNATEPTGDFTVPMTWKTGTPWTTNAGNGYRIVESDWRKERFARTLSTLGTSAAVAFLESEYAELISEYDVYGGITNAGFTGQATGFFHTERIGERTYIIDPLGNPYFVLGINDVTLGATANQQRYSKASYGLEEDYFERITRSLKETGINLAAVSSHMHLLKVPDGLPVVISVGTNAAYMASIGRSQISEGVFPHNNTINVFDPDFVGTAHETARTVIQAGDYADNPFVFGYTSDNELPSGDDILTRYLTLECTDEPTNGFSYATAWTWLARRMGTSTPSLEEYYASPERLQMNREFLGFIYARYYRVTREAIEAVDPNHMYLGSRINGTLYTNEDYHRAAGYYLDIITANLYGGLNPVGTTMTGFYRNAGIPFIVTEFFAKGMDAIDANGYKLANSTGAGILVQTQQARADYYEHYVLALLESKACVGWVWYRFRDNDQGIYTSTGSNKLIMLNVTYGIDARPNTFMDPETGKILTAAEVGKYTEIYKGDSLASNQNVNKGLYNNNFSSVVAVYEYDKTGKLIGSMAYEVETPESRKPEAGTILVGTNGERYTVGKVTDADGGYTETVLTVYEGKYVAFADAIKNISDHLIGLVQYFDAE